MVRGMMPTYFFPFLDIDNPITKGQSSAISSAIDQSKVETLISFGFQEEIARKALKASASFCLQTMLSF